MLPKPEKPKKGQNNPEQLDLVESISQENKLAKKRRFVIIFLILTVGLSVGFSVYHTCRNIIVNHQYPKISFKLPQISSPKTNSFSSVSLDSYLPKDSQDWSINIQTLSTNKAPFSYNHSSESFDLNQIKDTLSKLPVSTDSLTQSNLPSGVQVKEINDYKNNILTVNSLLTVPQKQIIFLFKVKTTNPEADKKTITSIIEQAYYQIMNSD